MTIRSMKRKGHRFLRLVTITSRLVQVPTRGYMWRQYLHRWCTLKWIVLRTTGKMLGKMMTNWTNIIKDLKSVQVKQKNDWCRTQVLSRVWWRWISPIRSWQDWRPMLARDSLQVQTRICGTLLRHKMLQHHTSLIILMHGDYSQWKDVRLVIPTTICGLHSVMSMDSECTTATWLRIAEVSTMWWHMQESQMKVRICCWLCLLQQKNRQIILRATKYSSC